MKIGANQLPGAFPYILQGSCTVPLCSCKVWKDSKQRTPQHLLFYDQTNTEGHGERKGEPGDTVTKATSVKSLTDPK